MKIIVGIPAYNEEQNIAKIIVRLKKVVSEVIVCDDGSNDLTSNIAKEMGASVIKHDINRGYGAAINSLFVKAKELDADVFVTFDADGQHRIEDIDRVIEPIKNNSADIVIGSRFLTDKDDEVPKYRKFGIKLITKVTNASIKESLTDSQSGFRSYNKKVLEKITVSDQGMGVSTEILIKADNLGFRIAEVPIKVLYGENTSTHDPVSHGFSVILSTIKFTSIEHPLKFYGIPGIVLFAIGMFFATYSIQFYSEIGRLNTNLTLIALGTILLGIILLITSVLLFSLVSVVREK